jgi:hypothetical protein
MVSGLVISPCERNDERRLHRNREISQISIFIANDDSRRVVLMKILSTSRLKRLVMDKLNVAIARYSRWWSCCVPCSNEIEEMTVLELMKALTTRQAE